MTRKSRAKSSSLFLLELILAILIFSIASAICVQFFVKSHLLSRDSRVLELSISEVSSIAEIIYISDSLEDSVNTIVALHTGVSQTTSNTTNESEQTDLTLYYDQDFNHCTQNEAQYMMQVALGAENHMLSANLEILSSETLESIYSLNVSHHLQRRVSYE